jgi:hypothetical protein
MNSLEHVLDSYYTQQDSYLLDIWHDFFEKARPDNLLYNKGDNFFNYMTSSLTYVLIKTEHENLSNSLDHLTDPINKSHLNELVNSYVPQGSLIFEDDELIFKDSLNQEVSITLDYYISSSDKTYGLKYNPTLEELNAINYYNDEFEGYSKILPITTDLTNLEVASELYNTFK